MAGGGDCILVVRGLGLEVEVEVGVTIAAFAVVARVVRVLVQSWQF